MPHFDPYGNPRPCVGCEHFPEFRAGRSIVLCMYGGRAQVNAQPEQGCVHWVHAIGSDDEKKKAKRRAWSMLES
jgi:hypothetical protein